MTANGESGLVLVLSQGMDPVIDMLATMLKDRLPFALIVYNQMPLSIEEIKRARKEFLLCTRKLVASRGIPVPELVADYPNIETVVTTDPIYRGITHLNGTDIRFFDTQPPNLVSYGNIAREISDYLTNGNSASATSERA